MKSTKGSITGRIAAVALATLVGDQMTKLASSAVPARTLGVVPIRNDAFSFGVVHAAASIAVVVMMLGIVAFGAYLIREAQRGAAPAWAVGLVLGGSISNLADRTAGGSVRDFLPIAHLAVVNVADLAVLVGIVGWLAGRSRLGSRPVVAPAGTATRG